VGGVRMSSAEPTILLDRSRVMSMVVRSTVFASGAPIPRRHSGERHIVTEGELMGTYQR
jgi:hypothetical protein